MVDEITDDLLLGALYPEWSDAMIVARRVGKALGRNLYEAPSTTLVGRRLSRLAREGLCEKKHENGSGFYRSRSHE